MKLTSAHIENFKGVKELDIDFGDPGRGSSLHALLGDNGSGKTSVLQAIALTLSMATRRTYPTIESFRWNGFLSERLSTLGDTRVVLNVRMEADEINACHEAFDLWAKSKSAGSENRPPIEPGSHHELELILETGGRVTCSQGLTGLFQFAGRDYVKNLLKVRPRAAALFARLGDVFWYDQYRNLGGLATEEETDGRPENWVAGIQQLRRFLLGWWAYHTSAQRRNGKDYIEELEQNFSRVFPETHFIGVEPMPSKGGMSESEFYFLLKRGDKIFDMAEMSSGEQSIFPLICDFVRLDIQESIVLVDELELHLHPPEQQAILSNLFRIGPDCQFIISTHSSFIEGSLLPTQITRLPGGRLCL